MELVDPRGRRPQLQAALAPRPRARDLRRIGFLSNEDEYMEGSLHFPRYTRILAKVTYTNIVLTDTSNDVTANPADVCRSFSSLFPC